MRKVLAMLLAVVLLCTVLPMAALADHNDDDLKSIYPGDCEICGSMMIFDFEVWKWKCSTSWKHKPVHTHSYTEATTKEATCIEAGVRTFTCSCGDSYTEEIPVNLNNHNYAVVEGETASTCTVPGHTAKEKCEWCNVEKGGDEKALDPSNHVNVSDVWETVTPATCLEDGLEKRVCKDCGETAESRPIKAKGEHTFGEWKVEKEAGCVPGVNDGLKRRECTVEGCDGFEEEVITAAHDWSEWEYVEGKEPTCTEGGRKFRSCSKCEDTQEAPADALGHNWDEESWVNDNADHWHVCLRCGETKDKSAHTSEKWVEGEDVHYMNCDVCGKRFNDTAHEYGPYTTVQEMTCTQDKIEVAECKVCGHEDKVVTPTKGHNIEKFPGKPATCTEPGVTDFEKCANPGCNYQKGNEVIPALGHDKDEKWTDCGDGEHHHKVCDVCGIEMEREHHDWHKGEKHFGHTHYYCDDCGAEMKVNNRHDHHHYNDGSNPKTSDDSNIFVWVTVMSLSAVALVGTSIYGLKKRKHN